MDQVVCSSMGERFVTQLELDSTFRQMVAGRMTPAPRMPSSALDLRATALCSAVSEVNIVDRNDYGKYDEHAVELARQNGADPAGSVETTHGLVRLTSDAPFAFISGIANRLGRFNDEVTADNPYAQNFAAAHNAAVVAAWLIPELAMFLATGSESGG
jgi:hypothetical protein